MTERSINAKALLKIIAHAAKYQDATIIGLLVGKDNIITNSFPLYHSPITLTLTIAVEQIRLFQNDEIIGFYYSSGNNNSSDLPISVQETKSMLSDLIKDLLVLNLDFNQYNHSNADFIKCSELKIKCDALALKGVRNMIEKRSYSLLVDFDEHLDNHGLNWMANPKFTLANLNT